MANQLSRHWKLAIIWALSLVTVGAISSAAQGRLPLTPTQTPTVISGSDIGFRIERTQDGIQIGRVVVRVNGVWVDTAAPIAAAR